jgi:hypothetical protein
MRRKTGNIVAALLAVVCALLGAPCYGGQPTLLPASGGAAISADTSEGAYTTLTGPLYQEGSSGDISQGTIVLNAPNGFVFDASSIVTVQLGGGSAANHNINNLTNGAAIPATVSTNAITITISAKSNGGSTNTLTWQNIRVRPVSGAPLARGQITNSGTATMPGVTTTTNLGTLVEIAGSVAKLGLSGFPNPQPAGSAGGVTAVARDQFGTVSSNYTGTIHFTSSDEQALLPADYTFLLSDHGTHLFTAGVTLKSAGSQSITATDTGTATITGSQTNITVTAAPAARLVFSTQPGSAIVGALLGTQPAVSVQDAYGNSSTSGLGSSLLVTMSVSSGGGNLLGTTNIDAGLSAGNGTATFTDLRVTSAGPKQLIATASGLSSGVSATFTVAQGNTTNAVSTSINPSPTGSNVTFTATLTAVAPASGTPSGTVEFIADGSALGAPVVVSNRIATLTTALLSHGSHAIIARYAGDTNFFGSTNSLVPNQVINAAPTAIGDLLNRFPTSGSKARKSALLSNDTDLENDPITFVSAGPASGAGGTISNRNAWVVYAPPGGFTNSDNFNYIISDSGGLLATGAVTVAIAAEPNVSQNLVNVQNLGNGAALVQFQGIAGRSYTVQYSLTQQTTDWHNLATGTADATGRFSLTDPSSAGRFYRSTYP